MHEMDEHIHGNSPDGIPKYSGVEPGTCEENYQKRWQNDSRTKFYTCNSSSSMMCSSQRRDMEVTTGRINVKTSNYLL